MIDLKLPLSVTHMNLCLRICSHSCIYNWHPDTTACKVHSTLYIKSQHYYLFSSYLSSVTVYTPFTRSWQVSCDMFTK